MVGSLRALDPDVILLNSLGGNSPRVWGYWVASRDPDSAVLVRNGLRARPLLLRGLIAITVESDEGPITIATTYVRPGENLPIEGLLDLANRANPSYVLADLNANHPMWGYRATSRSGLQLVGLMGAGKFERLGPEFDTWFGGRGGKGRPDVVLANMRTYLHYRIWNGGWTSSDHCMLVLDISASPIQTPMKTRYCMKKSNWSGYREHMSECQLPEMCDGTTLNEVDAAVERLMTTLKYAKDMYVPKISHRVLPGPYASDNTKELRVRLRNLYARMAAGSEVMRDVIRTQRLLVASAREDYDNSWRRIIVRLIDDHKTDSKSFWAAIKRLQGVRERRRMEGVRNGDGRILTTSREICDAFAGRLRNIHRISPEENDDFDEEREEQVIAELEAMHGRTVPMDAVDISVLPRMGIAAPISVQDVRRAVSSFRERAPGESGVTSTMLKQLPECTQEWLASLFTSCLALGYFPRGWKGAVVCMIPKVPHARGVEEYRPISLLETIGKVFERILNTRLTANLENLGMFGELQFGFRANRGTEMAIALCYERLAMTKAHGGQALTVLRDVSKAFDKVWHEGLKWKILQLNLPIPVGRVLCSYLDDRWARVSWGDSVSAEVRLVAGVPQGGILSPTLYNLYVRDSPEAQLPSLNIGYADDITQCIATDWKNKRHLLMVSSREISELTRFEREWKIRTNPNKFGLVPIAMLPHKMPPLEVDGRRIEWKSKGRMLGWEIAWQRGMCKGRMEEMAAIGRGELARLRRFWRLPEKLKKQLYVALVRSRLTYPCVPLHVLGSNALRPLQRVQNAGVRFVLGASLVDRISSEALHLRAGIPALNVWLNQRAVGVWDALERHAPGAVRLLGEWHPDTEQHGWFASSRRNLDVEPPMYV